MASVVSKFWLLKASCAKELSYKKKINMATQFSISSYTLAFSTDFKSLLVKDASGNQVASYAMDQSGTGVLLSIASGSYELSSDSSLPNASVHIDVAQSPDLAFDGVRLGGTVIIDLRDIGRSNSSNNCQEIDCILAECDYRFWYDSSSGFSLKIQFDDPDSFSNQAC